MTQKLGTEATLAILRPHVSFPLVIGKHNSYIILVGHMVYRRRLSKDC